MASPRLPRLLSALPDGVTAAFFLLLWLQPLRFGEAGVCNGMLVMLVEFILIHASVILGNLAFAPGVGRRRKLASLAGFGGFYLLFIAAWSWTFREWWPFVAFGWLLLAKVGVALDTRRPAAERLHRMQSGWALATMAYLAGAFMTVFVPLPRLGITADVLPALALPGGGLWVDRPHTVIAFGTLYFGMLAWSKARDLRLPRAHLPGANADP